MFGQLGREEARHARPLSDKERAEADNLSADGIAAIKDVAKLKRFEAYFRQEGYEPTADAVRRRIADLGQVDPLHDPHQDQEARADLDSYRTSLKTWTAAAKTAEQELLARKAGAVGGREAPAPRPRAYIAVPAAKEADKGSAAHSQLQAATDTAKDQDRTSHTGKPDSKFGGQVRSGSDYYRNWDKFTEQALAQQEQEEADMPPASNKVPAPKPKAAAANGHTTGSKPQQAAGGAVRTQQLLDLNRSTLTPPELEHLAANEKSKGNESFRDQDWKQAVEHYTLALGYTPNNASLHGNRAAAYKQLQMYKEVIQDCDKALELDPHYVKALVRRALARLELNYHLEALVDIDAALVLEPNDKQLTDMKHRALTALGLGKPAKTTRLVVQEESDEDEEVSVAACEPMSAAAADMASQAKPQHAEAGQLQVQKQAEGKATQASVAGAAKQTAAEPAAAPSDQSKQQQQGSRIQTRTSIRTVLKVEESDDEVDFASAGSSSSQIHSPAAVNAAQQPKPATTSAATQPQPAAVEPKPSVVAAPKPAAKATAKAAPTAAPVPAAASLPTPVAKPTPATQAPASVRQQASSPPMPTAAAASSPATPAPSAAPSPATPALSAAPGPAPEPSVEERVATIKAQAFKCMTSGDRAGAIEQYAQALKLQPDDAELLIDRSFAKLKGNDGKGALMDAAVAVQLDSGSARAMHARAQAKLQLGLIKAGASDLAEAQDLSGSSSLKADIKREANKVAQILAKKAAAGPKVVHRTVSDTHGLVIEEHADEEDEEGALITSSQLSRLEAEAVGRAMRAKKQAQSLRDQAAAAAAEAAAAALHVQQQAQAEDAAAAAAATAAAAVTAGSQDAGIFQPAQPLGSALPAMHAEEQRQQSAEDLKAAGNAAYAEGDLELACALWERALAASESRSELARACRVNLATVKLELGDAEAALHHANTVLQVEPGNVKSLFRQAMALKALGRLEEAAHALRLVKAERGQSELIDKELADIADLMAAAGKKPRQQAQPQQVTIPAPAQVQQPTTQPVAVAQPATTVLAAAQTEAESTLAAHEPVAVPDASAAPAADGQQQRDAASVQQLQQASSADELAASQAREQAAAAAKDQGNELFRQGKYMEAMDMYRQSLAIKPLKEVYSNMALIQFRDGQLNEAEQSCKAALQLDPHYTKATYRLASVMRARHQHQEEATLLQQCVLQSTAAVAAGDPTAQAQLDKMMHELQQVEALLASMQAAAQPAETVVRNKITVTEVSETDSEDESPSAVNGQGVQQQVHTANGKGPGHAGMPVAAASHLRPSSSGGGSPSSGGGSSDAGSGSGQQQRLGSRSSSGRGGLVQQKVAAAIASLTKEGLPPPPKSATEFLNGCKTMSSDTQRLATYVKSIDPVSYPAVFKSALDITCLSNLLRALSHIAKADASFALQALQQLSQVPRFSMMVAMLKPADKAAVADILSAVEVDQGTDITSLRKVYRA